MALDPNGSDANGAESNGANGATQQQLRECELILGEQTDDAVADARVFRQTRLRVCVLSEFVKNLCVRATGPQSPAVTFELISGVAAALAGIDAVSRALKHTERGCSAETARELSEDRKGVLKNIASDVNCNVYTTESSDWIVTPVLRHIVAALKEIDASIGQASGST
jgi:hypothetical protein